MNNKIDDNLSEFDDDDEISKKEYNISNIHPILSILRTPKYPLKL